MGRLGRVCQFCKIFLDAGASVVAACPYGRVVHEGGELFELSSDLVGELSGIGHDEALMRLVLCLGVRPAQVLKDPQDKDGCLSCACSCLTEDMIALHDLGDSHDLNGTGLLEAKLLNCLQ